MDIRAIIIFVSLLILAFIGFDTFNIIDNDTNSLSLNDASSTISYGRFLSYLDMGWIQHLDFYQGNQSAVIQVSSPDLGNKNQLLRVNVPMGNSQLIQTLKDYGVDFDSHPIPKKNIYLTIASNLLLPLIFILSLLFFFQNSENPTNIGESQARFNYQPDTKVSFKDVAGIDEAQAEFEEIISFLEEPERYRVVGARIPKGVLLVGPPGTGKTLLAKAISSEAKVPFFSAAGSEFVEMFIGVGASRVRDLFSKASEKTPCLIFIDEIDAVGRERGAGIGGGNDEREQTLNQLLTEMDGFKDNKGIIVIGATNRVDILDKALVRPGRFDRQITVGLPDRNGRLEILKVHARNKPMDENISLRSVANQTTGFSGADLANLLNEAAILTTRYNKDKMTKNEIDEAINRVIGGIAGASLEPSSQKRLIAYHEVGHALIGTLSQFHDDIEKISLIPRGNAKGYTWFVPSDDGSSFITRVELCSRVATLLGGRIAERVVFGEPNITTAAANDILNLTRIARGMVTKYGMANLAPFALEDQNDQMRFKSLLNRMSDQVVSIINYCEEIGADILRENRVIVDYLAKRLVQKENIEGDEFREIVGQFTKLPLKFKNFRTSYCELETLNVFS